MDAGPRPLYILTLLKSSDFRHSDVTSSIKQHALIRPTSIQSPFKHVNTRTPHQAQMPLSLTKTILQIDKPFEKHYYYY